MSSTNDIQREKYTKKKYYAIIAVLIVVSSSLIVHYGTTLFRGYSDQAPLQTDDGWKTASLADVGMDKDTIDKLMNDLSKKNDNHVHSIIIVKDGRLVFEEYFSGDDLDFANGLGFVHKEFNLNTTHAMASASKSVTSILLGIAIDQGKIEGVQKLAYSFFPEYSDPNDVVKGRITLKDMLTMSSGLPWDEDSYPFSDPRNDLNKMFLSADPIGFMLTKPIETPPGSKFHYNSGTTNVLGDVVRIGTGKTLAEFAEQYLFDPLGITSFSWVAFPKAPQIAIASSTLFLRPRDMAKIGELYLERGVWNGTRIVPEDWVTESTSQSIQVPDEENPLRGENASGFVHSYGYLWWRGTFSEGNTETFFAAGFGGQYIYVLPSLDMVIVITAGSFQGESYQGFYDIINNYILPATIK